MPGVTHEMRTTQCRGRIAAWSILVHTPTRGSLNWSYWPRSAASWGDRSTSRTTATRRSPTNSLRVDSGAWLLTAPALDRDDGLASLLPERSTSALGSYPRIAPCGRGLLPQHGARADPLSPDDPALSRYPHDRFLAYTARGRPHGRRTRAEPLTSMPCNTPCIRSRTASAPIRITTSFTAKASPDSFKSHTITIRLSGKTRLCGARFFGGLAPLLVYSRLCDRLSRPAPVPTLHVTPRRQRRWASGIDAGFHGPRDNWRLPHPSQSRSQAETGPDTSCFVDCTLLRKVYHPCTNYADYSLLRHC